ncbi:hypothetical protein D3C81_1833220 [compost metagenome]
MDRVTPVCFVFSFMPHDEIAQWNHILRFMTHQHLIGILVELVHICIQLELHGRITLSTVPCVCYENAKKLHPTIGDQEYSVNH